MLNGVKVRALRGDMLAPVDGEQFDLVLANPPYVPGASDHLPPDSGPSRAWEGGRDGREVHRPAHRSACQMHLTARRARR